MAISWMTPFLIQHARSIQKTRESTEYGARPRQRVGKSNIAKTTQDRHNAKPIPRKPAGN